MLSLLLSYLFSYTFSSDWSYRTTNLWVDDQLCDSGFPLFYYTSTQHLRAVNIYSFQDPYTWIDEIKLILNEATRVDFPLDIASIQVINGQWSGTIAPQQETTSMIIQVFKEQTNPSISRRGESNPFTVGPGIIYSSNSQIILYHCNL